MTKNEIRVTEDLDKKGINLIFELLGDWGANVLYAYLVRKGRSSQEFLATRHLGSDSDLNGKKKINAGEIESFISETVAGEELSFVTSLVIKIIGERKFNELTVCRVDNLSKNKPKTKKHYKDHDRGGRFGGRGR
jgi:hypothetical protein